MMVLEDLPQNLNYVHRLGFLMMDFILAQCPSNSMEHVKNILLADVSENGISLTMFFANELTQVLQILRRELIEEDRHPTKELFSKTTSKSMENRVMLIESTILLRIYRIIWLVITRQYHALSETLSEMKACFLETENGKDTQLFEGISCHYRVMDMIDLTSCVIPDGTRSRNLMLSVSPEATFQLEFPEWESFRLHSEFALLTEMVVIKSIIRLIKRGLSKIQAELGLNTLFRDFDLVARLRLLKCRQLRELHRLIGRLMAQMELKEGMTRIGTRFLFMTIRWFNFTCPCLFHICLASSFSVMDKISRNQWWLFEEVARIRSRICLMDSIDSS